MLELTVTFGFESDADRIEAELMVIQLVTIPPCRSSNVTYGRRTDEPPYRGKDVMYFDVEKVREYWELPLLVVELAKINVLAELPFERSPYGD